jgi:hypothetical protein
MKRRLLAAIAAAMCGLLFQGDRAWAQYLDSSLFNHQYNGDTAPDANGYTHNAGAEATWMPVSDGDIMSYQGEIDLGGYWQSDDWPSGTSTVNNTNGWTIEFRAKIGTDAQEDTQFGVFNVFAKDVNGNNSQGRRASVAIYQEKTRVSSKSLDVDFNDNTDAFHVFRFGQAAGSSQMYMWRDGVQILANSVSQGGNDGSSLTAQLWFGDGTSGNGSTDLNPTVFLDYMRWDDTGLTAPDRLFGFEPGDLNADGVVDKDGDYNIIKANWLQPVTPSIATGDLNFDSIVDVFDFAIFKQEYLTANPGGSAADIPMPVPEPATLVLLAAALPVWFFARRRRSQ